MSLGKVNASAATGTRNRVSDVAPSSGICAVCVDGCPGYCEVAKSGLRGREILYPQPFGEITAGAQKDYPVDYSHLNILGTCVGAVGLPADPDVALFNAVDIQTEIGAKEKMVLKAPIFTGALGSTEIARVNWEHLAAGAAISGITIVCGENVCGVDPELELDSEGKVKKSPEMDRRIEIYRRFYEGYGELIVQANVEDLRLGVPEYLASKHNLETIELKWGQGAKSIGGEIKVKTIERAIELKKREYIVLPDPENQAGREGYQKGAIKEFERHSRLAFVGRESFLKEVDRLRGIGFKRITLKTGAYSAVDLAMALRFGAEVGLDLITIDGAGGGTGMSPWPMMNEWGIPTFYLESLAYQFCRKLEERGFRVPDIAIAGGFSTEDGVFKAIAMGAPYVKAVCMGRALMIPGMVGKNIDKWLKEGNLPKTVSKYGDSIEKIFICYEELKEKYGSGIKEIPLGAIAMYTFSQKIKTGLQQLMAGSRNFKISTMSRSDLMALTEEAAKISGIPYVMEAYREEAEKILEE